MEFTFRFLAAWCKEVSCEEVIKAAWSIPVSGYHGYKLITRLENTKRALKEWNRNVFGRCDLRWKQLENNLVWLQNQIPKRANLEEEAAVHMEILGVWVRTELI